MLLKKGIRWWIGSDSNVNVWNHSWLREEDGVFLQTPPYSDLSNLSVADLFLLGSKAWNVQLLNYLFHPRDMSAILGVPLLPFISNDQQFWSPRQDGEYTVKSGTWFISERLTNISYLKAEGNWNRLWKMVIPPKVKHFLWRLCRNCLPTRINLQDRGVQCPSLCIHCDSNLETD